MGNVHWCGKLETWGTCIGASRLGGRIWRGRNRDSLVISFSLQMQINKGFDSGGQFGREL